METVLDISAVLVDTVGVSVILCVVFSADTADIPNNIIDIKTMINSFLILTTPN